MIRASAVLLGDRAARALDQLESSPSAESRSIARRAHSLKPVLLADCLHGEVVRKSAIPVILRERHGVENLYVEDLPAFWRLLYTVVRREGQRVILVVEIVDHRAYDRWFPGRKR